MGGGRAYGKKGWRSLAKFSVLDFCALSLSQVLPGRHVVA